MASPLRLSLFLLATTLSVTAFDDSFYRRTSLCERSARNGEVRQCMRGTGRSRCPRGWKVYKAKNLLLCWARKDVTCCQQEDEEPPTTTLPPPPPPPPTTTTPPPPPPQLNHPGCGLSPVSPRITRGRNEVKCGSPWQVSLRSRITNDTFPLDFSNTVHVAGGVLVQSGWVLTTPVSALLAGQTQPGNRFQQQMLVVAGDHDHNDIDGDEQTRLVEDVFFHPDFRFPETIDFVSVIEEGFFEGTEAVWQANAFALIKLQRDFDLRSPCVVPACLPECDQPGFCSSPQCRLTGWGTDENDDLKDVLQRAEIEVFDTDTCSQLEGVLDNTDPVIYPPRTTCILNENISFACVGDFGGPVVCPVSQSPTRFNVEGLAVTRLDCNDAIVPSRIAVVGQAMDWIRDTILNFS